jgi:hypothetical protein
MSHEGLISRSDLLITTTKKKRAGGELAAPCSLTPHPGANAYSQVTRSAGRM